MTKRKTSSLKVVLADDEPLALLRLDRCLEHLGCEVLAKFAHGGDLVAWLQTHDMPDALFLDVQMPGASGLDILAEFSTQVPIVLVTSGVEFAVHAFDFSATDFLLKPVVPERVEKALDRIRKSLGVTSTKPRGQASLRIPVIAGAGTVLLEVTKISHFELAEGQVWACTSSSRFQTRWRSLQQVERAMQDVGLVRLNRTLLVRPEAVRGLRTLRFGRRMILLADGLEYAASRRGTLDLNRILGLQ